MNQLILGDNLEIMRNMKCESVDLIYLDPPFFSNRNYEVIWGDEGEIRSFQDRWAGGIEHYIEWLKERVVEMHRLLKSTGSIYLHCDWHADAEIKIFILNKIFGENNFRGDIIWQRTNAHNDAKKKLAVLTDTLWYYSKSDKFIYNPIYGDYGEKYLKDFYKYEDEKGTYRLGDLTNTKPGPYNYEYKGYKPNQNGWRCPLEKMIEWDKQGLINFPENKKGRLSLKRYLDIEKGALLGNIWTDINNVQGNARIGYPTQKPEKLLERIILASSNEDDIVLDPFLGGGTTVVVADRLKRQWLGIDQSVQAIKVSEFRLNKQQNLFSSSFEIKLHKYDYDRLFNMNAFDFERWIVEQFGGIPNIKQRNDFGMDGKLRDGTPVQVKQSESIGRNVIDNFKSACERYDKALYKKNKEAKSPVGYIIAFSFNKGAIEEVSRLKMQENIEIKLMRVDAIVPIAKKPKLSVELKETGRDTKGTSIEFSAIAESSTGIEFYSYDYDYDETKPFNAEVILDKTGKQTFKFKPGSHTIAVKAIDNEGMEAIEVVKIKVNGEVELFNKNSLP